jgi:hypothetical protein
MSVFKQRGYMIYYDEELGEWVETENEDEQERLDIALVTNLEEFYLTEPEEI